MFFFFLLSYPTCLIETVPHVSILILEALASLAVENRILPMYNRFRTTGLCHLVMFVIDADRKVCPPYQYYLIKAYRS